MGVIGVGASGTAAGQARKACNTEVSTAEQRYQDGAFDEAIGLIAECLDQARLAPEQAVRAYRTLTLAHLKRDEVTAARWAIISLLSAHPHYIPDPVEEPPVYVAMVSLVRRELRLGPSAVPVRAVQPLALSPAVVEAEIARPPSLRDRQDRPDASGGNEGERRRQKVGW